MVAPPRFFYITLMNQCTIAKSVIFEGVGVHSGRIARAVVHPADAGHGIIFKRVDIEDRNNIVPARWDHVIPSELCTVIANQDGTSVSTVEHLRAALEGCNIHNALVEIDGDEIPILDGSSKEFVDAFLEAGVVDQGIKRRVLRILKDVTIVDGMKRITLRPLKDGEASTFKVRIDFEHKSIGVQERREAMINGNFVHNLAGARTFCMFKDVEFLRSKGLARGGSLENAIVINDEGIMNEGGLRYEDEFVRHKMLDAKGDIALVDAAFEGHYDGDMPSHRLNNNVLRALHAMPDAYIYQ